MTDTQNQRKLPEVGLACSLSARGQVDRRVWLERLNGQALGVRTRPDGVSVEFAGDDDTEADVKALAIAEARCCPFLTLEVTREEGRLVLVVFGPPEARPIIESMFQVRP